MRTVSPAQLAAMQAGSGSNHGLLIELVLSITTLRATTYHADCTWNGQTWIGGGIFNAQVQPNENNEATATITIGNPDGSFLATLRAEGWINAPVRIWFVSTGPGAIGLADVLRIFSGNVSRYSDNGMTTTLNCHELGASDQFSPRILTDEICNHIPRPGTHIVWGVQTYIVQRGP